ncbi:MAG: hypothetical protein IKM75_05205 [Bacteroidales bacterium]|nr:hypothetical protein [Bacteroidales bacterium]
MEKRKGRTGRIGARWRCRPSVQESPFSGKIQGVEAVEVGGSGGGCALAPIPASCSGLRHSCGSGGV